MRIPLYEKIWLAFAGVILLALLTAAVVSAFAVGRHPPSHLETVRPERVTQDPPFNNPRIEQVGPNEYVAYMRAFTFGFLPNQLTIPAGSRLTIRITSSDVVHGFNLVGTNVHGMVIPGYVTELTGTFPRPGEYLILCDEYCGLGHQLMQAKLIVE